ncbi:MAG: hypothetical protein IJC74_08760 [Clostridia bacterium]|nr:hypothetical protein [Clostridia bacterium]
MKKRIIALTAAAALTLGASAFAEDTIELISAEEVTMEDTLPVINGMRIAGIETVEADGITMLPLRAVAEGLGYTVNWIDESRTIELTQGAQFITFSIDADSYAFSRRAPIELGTVPKLIGEFTYVPLNFIDEILGGCYQKAEDGTWEFETLSVVDVTKINEDGSLTVNDIARGEVIVKIAEETEFSGEAKFEDIKEGMTISVSYSDAMTMSIPPQVAARKIFLTNLPVEEVSGIEFAGEITEVGEGFVTIGDPAKDADAKTLNISEETVIEGGEAADLKVGVKISGTHADAMTRSLPPQTNAIKIVIEK